MYLKSLEIAGFKSFAKKAELDFTSPITAVVGPNGSGKCVAGSTIIQLSTGERVPIKNLFDRAYEKAQIINQFDDGLAVIETDEQCKVASLNLETLKIEWRTVSAFIRRTAPDKMLKIKTGSGRLITATEYHPLFVYKDGVIQTVRADELKPGVPVATPRVLITESVYQKLSIPKIASLFKLSDLIYVPATNLLKDLAVHAQVREALDSNSRAILRRVSQDQALNISYLSEFFDNFSEMTYYDTLLKSKGTGVMRVPEALDEKLARILGYLISEGTNDGKGQVRFVNDDIDVVNDFVICSKDVFNLEAKIFSYKNKTKDVIIFSKALNHFLDRVLDFPIRGNSFKKKVPDLIFKSPDIVIVHFLSALFDGDGYYNYKTKPKLQSYFEYCTASRALADDVVSLLLRLGIVASIRSKQKYASNTDAKIKRTYYSVYVYGYNQLRMLANRLRPNGRKIESIKKMRNLPEVDNLNIDLIPNVLDDVRQLVREAGVAVKNTRKELPLLSAYCEKRCTASRPGLLRVVDLVERKGNRNDLVEQSLYGLKKLALSEILWDEITSVEEEAAEQYVYDLTVEDNHNFVANNFFVHNSNIADSFRYVLGEQSIKSMRGKRGEDMIFSGSNKVAKMNRASVRLTFDNRKRVLNVDFDEVVLERVVHRDSSNEYFINGSQVRLKDILELLATAHIGATGHHIISQGEADKILNANSKERKAMIEDALGLKIYQYKRIEAERKLEKTEENIKSVESLRRELAPHLKFLGKQVEKIEKTALMRQDLAELYKQYFKKENLYLKHERFVVESQLKGPLQELKQLDEELTSAKKVLAEEGKKSYQHDQILSIEKETNTARAEEQKMLRELGRIEGELSGTERSLNAMRHASAQQAQIPISDLEHLEKQIDGAVVRSQDLQEIGEVRKLLLHIKDLIVGLVDRHRKGSTTKWQEHYGHDLKRLQEQKYNTEKTLNLVRQTLEQSQRALEEARGRVEKEKKGNLEAEKTILRIMTRQNEINALLSKLKSQEERLLIEEEDFKRDQKDAAMIIGRSALDYDGVEAHGEEERGIQKERHRAIDRLKIRLEEAGSGGGEDILKEFNDSKERDAFLAKEVDDLQRAAASLLSLIADLKQKLDLEFKEGIAKINVQFQNYFSLMFGGGSAGLEIIKEEPRRRSLSGLLGFSSNEDEIDENEHDKTQMAEEGIDIKVNMPHKKIKGLSMLSGGERALTSIALLFAMSQVNPPPFIILDETDAALDEANSRKYGDMVENLAKHSQLILITHNRETMSRAGVLYGVTMGADGASKLLSIQFEEAVQVAK